MDSISSTEMKFLGLLQFWVMMFITSTAIAQPAWDWARSGIGSDSVIATGVETDLLSSDIITTGYYRNASFTVQPTGSPSFPMPVQTDGFVMRFDSTGAAVWQFTIGNDNGRVEPHDVYVDSFGNIYLTGVLQGDVNLQGIMGGPQNVQSLLNTEDAFIVKYNASGLYQWHTLLGGTADEVGKAIHVAADGVYVTGSFENGNMLTANHQGAKDAFVAKVTVNSGVLQWLTHWGGSGNDEGLSITANANKVFAGGFFRNQNADIYEPNSIAVVNNMPNQGGEDAIYVTFNAANGTFDYYERIRSSGDDRLYALLLDGDSLYVAGYSGLNTTFSGVASVTGQSTADIFLAQYNLTGSANWALAENSIGGTGEDIPYGLSLLGNGHVMMAGVCTDNVVFNGSGGVGDTLFSNNGDPFLVVYNNTGGFEYALFNSTGNGKDAFLDVACFADTLAYACGYYESSAGTIVFTPAEVLPSGGEVAAMVARIDINICDAAFQYDASLYCDTAADPLPVIFGDAGGVFSASTGLVVDGTTGELDLSSAVNGSYEVYYTAPAGCEDTFAVNIQALNPPTFAGNDQLICSGTTATLNADVPVSGTAFWTVAGGSANVTNPSNENSGVTGLQNGSNVFVWNVDQGICGVAMDSVEVVLDNTNPIITCPADQTLYVGSSCDVALPDFTTMALPTDDCTPAGSILLQQNPIPGTLVSSDLSVTITASDGNNNAASCSFNVVVADTIPPVVVCANDTVLCDSIVNFSLPTATDNCTSNPTITQTDGTGLTPGAQFPIGTTVLTYAVSDASGNTVSCSISVSVLIPIHPNFSMTLDTLVCLQTAPIDLTGFVTLNFGETSTFSSYDGAVLTNNATTFDPGLSGVGTYHLVHFVDNGFCTDADTIEIEVLPTYNADFTLPDSVCAAGGMLALDDYLDTQADLGGTWSGTGVNANVFDPTGLEGQDIVLMYDVGLSPCVATQTQTIHVALPVDATWAFVTDTVCNDVMIDLSTLVSGTAGGVWSGTGVTGNVFSPFGLTGDVTVWYRLDNGGCRDSLMQTIHLVEPPTADAGVTDSVCGFEVQLGAFSSTGSGSWLPVPGVVFSDAADATATVTVQAEGMYTLYWEVASQCTVVDSVMVYFYESPTADAGPDQVLSSDNSTFLEGSLGAGTGVWSVLSGGSHITDVNDPNAEVNNLPEGQTVLLWTVTNGVCPAVTDTMKINYTSFFIPTGFSPNGDGVNDQFVIEGLPDQTIVFEVFNRWGVQVYLNENYNNTWDGHHQNGNVLVDDTYFYILKVGDGAPYSGSITLKR